MEPVLNYLAYGSNLCRTRLFARIGVCDVVGVATIPGRSMAFRKKSHDGSAKCDLFATHSQDSTEGVVYQMPQRLQPVLDRFEGVGVGYRVADVEVVVDGQTLSTIAYEAVAPWITDDLLPFRWYREFVLQGAKDFGLSPAWIDAVENHPVEEDLDDARVALNHRILNMTVEEADAMSRLGGSS